MFCVKRNVDRIHRFVGDLLFLPKHMRLHDQFSIVFMNYVRFWWPAIVDGVQYSTVSNLDLQSLNIKQLRAKVR